MTDVFDWKKLSIALVGAGLVCCTASDLLLFNGKVVTVDGKFTLAEAVAVTGGRIEAVGSNAEVEKFKSGAKEVIDLKGKTVLPGLIDSHVHPEAGMTEFDHPIPEMESIADVLDYVKAGAKVLG